MIWNRNTKISVALMIGSLLIKATSNLWLAELLNGGGLSSTFITYLYMGLLVGCYLFSIIPDSATTVYVEKAELEATKTFVEKFKNSHRNIPQLQLDLDLKKKNQAFLTTQARKVFREGLMVLWQGVTNVSSIVIDAATMCVIISPWYGPAYVIGLGCYMGTMQFFKGQIKLMAKKNQERNTSLNNILETAWDNTVIGNDYSYELWQKDFNSEFNLLKNITVSYVKFVKITSSFATIIGILPILGTTVWLFHNSLGNFNAMALIIAVLPRQLQTIQYFTLASSSYARWNGIKENMSDIENSVGDLSSNLDKEYKITFKGLQFFLNNIEEKYENILNFFNTVEHTKNGRFTIRGDNGFGKSVLLCNLNSYLISHDLPTFHLPLNTKLYFSEDTQKLSSGERLLSQLSQIIKDVGAKYILLDEWDANLTPENILLSSKKIEELAKTNCIIEIRHRKDEEIKEAHEKNKFKNEPLLVSFYNKRSAEHKINLLDKKQGKQLSLTSGTDYVLIDEYINPEKPPSSGSFSV